MTTRVVIYAAPRTGSHFVARMIARSTGAVYRSLDVKTDMPDSGCCWVTTTHDVYDSRDEQRLAEVGATALGLYRNPLDHALSFLDHPDPDAPELFAGATGEAFRVARQRVCAFPPDRRVSYDLLAMRNADEISRLSALIGWNGMMRGEPIEETRRAVPYVPMRYGQPGRWREVLPDATARAICDALGEPLPEVP